VTHRPILLDTCALLWIANDEPVAPDALKAFVNAADTPGGVLASPISAWEVGQLVARGRLMLPIEPLNWFEAALAAGIVLAPMPPAILVASSFLPHARLRDPADRILAATARAYDYRLMTRDKPLLEYSAEGHVQAIAC
jgi:PIN domain nuclease of toxin-antitoxin system